MEAKNIWETIKELKSNHEIILYGYSFLGKNIEQVLEKNSFSIGHIWDKSAKTNIPSISEPFENGNHEDLVIVCIGNSFIREQVKGSLLQRGYGNILPENVYKKLVNASLDLYEQKNKFSASEKSLSTQTEFERLQKAIDYAVETNYLVWEREYFFREKTRVAKNLVFSGYMEDDIAEDFFKNYCQNNGLNNLTAICSFNPDCYGKKALGVEYVEPQKLLELDDLFVVVNDTENHKIKDFLNNNHISWCDITDLELNVFDSKFSSEWFSEERENILKVYDWFEDAESKEIYVETICNRIAPHLSRKDYFELKSSEVQYFDSNILTFNNHENLVDAGAYTGDSIMSFLETVNSSFDNIFAFEMDENNFFEMKKNLEKDKIDPRIHLYRKGVYSKNEKTPYISNAGGSVMGTDSNQYVEMVMLDEFLKDNNISMIKMDIEGAELDALTGSKNIIKEQKPKIAMSVYHHLYDIWKIPLYLRNLNPEYRFKLRHYTNTVWDTDLYAYV